MPPYVYCIRRTLSNRLAGFGKVFGISNREIRLRGSVTSATMKDHWLRIEIVDSFPDDIISGGGRLELSFANLSILVQDEMFRVDKLLSPYMGVANNAKMLPSTDFTSSSTQTSRKLGQRSLTTENWANGIARILCSTLKCAHQTVHVALGGRPLGTPLLCNRPSGSTTALVAQFVLKHQGSWSETVAKLTILKVLNDGDILKVLNDGDTTRLSKFSREFDENEQSRHQIVSY